LACQIIDSGKALEQLEKFIEVTNSWLLCLMK
jgi:hypothetical protein